MEYKTGYYLDEKGGLWKKSIRTKLNGLSVFIMDITQSKGVVFYD